MILLSSIVHLTLMIMDDNVPTTVLFTNVIIYHEACSGVIKSHNTLTYTHFIALVPCSYASPFFILQFVLAIICGMAKSGEGLGESITSVTLRGQDPTASRFKHSRVEMV